MSDFDENGNDDNDDDFLEYGEEYDLEAYLREKYGIDTKIPYDLSKFILQIEQTLSNGMNRWQRNVHYNDNIVNDPMHLKPSMAFKVTEFPTGLLYRDDYREAFQDILNAIFHSSGKFDLITDTETGESILIISGYINKIGYS